MSLIDRIKELFRRPSSDVDFEGMKDDDAIARGSTPVAGTTGPGTQAELQDEFETDQESRRRPGQ
jgi:hypothetical protein